MTTETARQRNLFTGEWDDNRSRRQKELDRKRAQPRQTEMFSPGEIAQFGVNPHPLLPLSPNTKLGLIFEDPRTDEEIDHDRQRDAEALTSPMFDTQEQTPEQDEIPSDTRHES